MATPIPFTDLKEIKLHLNKVGQHSPEEESEIKLHLDSAVEAVEGWAPKGRAPVGPMVIRAFTERVTVGHRGKFVVSKTPLKGVTSATFASDNTIVVDTGFDDFDELTGIVHRSALSPGDWNVVFDAGRGVPADVPSSLKLAVLIIAAHIWETQRGPRTRNFYGQASVDETSGHKGSAGYLIPNRAAHLMQPFCGVLIG